MFRAMRRKRKAISTEAAQTLLMQARRGVLAVNGDDGYPYAVPVNFYYDAEAQKIFFHGSKVGHKAEALKACSKVCFTVFGNESVKDLNWAPYVQSVVIFGTCQAMTDPEEAAARLRGFARKYYPNEEEISREISESGKAVQMYEIKIEHMTGKEIQER